MLDLVGLKREGEFMSVAGGNTRIKALAPNGVFRHFTFSNADDDAVSKRKRLSDMRRFFNDNPDPGVKVGAIGTALFKAADKKFNPEPKPPRKGLPPAPTPKPKQTPAPVQSQAPAPAPVPPPPPPPAAPAAVTAPAATAPPRLQDAGFEAVVRTTPPVAVPPPTTTAAVKQLEIDMPKTNTPAPVAAKKATRTANKLNGLQTVQLADFLRGYAWDVAKPTEWKPIVAAASSLLGFEISQSSVTMLAGQLGFSLFVPPKVAKPMTTNQVLASYLKKVCEKLNIAVEKDLLDIIGK